MNEQPSLHELAERVSRGDTAAITRLRRDLEAQLERLVRHVLRTGQRASVLARRIHEEVERLHDGSLPPSLEQCERLVRHIAVRLGASMIDHLRARGFTARMADTLAN